MQYGCGSQGGFLFYGRRPEPTMHPAGKNGPSLSPSCLEMKQVAHGGLQSGGRLLPSLRLDGRATGVTPERSVSQPQEASPAEPANCGIAPPIRNALTLTALGEALDGEENDPKEIVRRLHANWGHASAQQL